MYAGRFTVRGQGRTWRDALNDLQVWSGADDDRQVQGIKIWGVAHEGRSQRYGVRGAGHAMASATAGSQMEQGLGVNSELARAISHGKMGENGNGR
jgi:hypothetical protein